MLVRYTCGVAGSARPGMAEKRSEEESACCVVSVTHSGSFGARRLFLVGFGTSERGIDREFWIETWHELLAHTLSSLPEQPQCIWTK